MGFPADAAAPGELFCSESGWIWAYAPKTIR
jgi:hypothetical protein